MSFAADLCEYLAEKHLLWDSSVIEDGFTLDVDMLNVSDFSSLQEIIYLNQIPSHKTDAICIYDTGGYEAFRMYSVCRPFDQPTAQIRVRNKSLRVAEETSYKIYTLLDDIYDVGIGERYYFRMNAVSLPSYVGEDLLTSAGKAFEYSFNMYAKVRRV